MVVESAITIPAVERSAGMTTQEYAYQRLRRGLMLGTIAPGVALTIRGLSEQLGISPTPVREALRRLGSENGLTVLENRRIRVPLMTAERLQDLVGLRAAVEAHAALSALPHVSDLVVDRLDQIDRELDAAVSKGELDSQLQLNQQFHRTLYCTNPETVTMPVVESLWLQLGPFLRIAGRHIKDLYRVDRHQEALAALRQRDGEALSAAIRADVFEGVGCLNPEAVECLLSDAGDN